MEVEAIQVGFYGHLREVGDRFTVSDAEAFSDVWMKKVPKSKSKAAADDDKPTE